MQLWTYHNASFNLTDPSLVIDHKRGHLWEYYQHVAEKLWGVLGTKQVLWCCTVANQFSRSQGEDRVEWELNVPESQIIGFHSRTHWNKLRDGKRQDWENLLRPRILRPHVEWVAWVKVPIAPHWATNLGQIPLNRPIRRL